MDWLSPSTSVRLSGETVTATAVYTVVTRSIDQSVVNGTVV
jgi:hypothetical protein